MTIPRAQELPLTIFIAIALAVIASACFAGGATLQHLGIERNLSGSEDRAMTFGRLVQLLRTPLWLLGGLLLVGGMGLHVVGLSMAPLAVIQPVGILAVPFSILLAKRIHHHPTESRVWWAALMTVLGIVAFTWLSATHTDAHHLPVMRDALIAYVVIWAAALVCGVAAAKGPARLKNLLWAWAGAFLYGLGSAFIKLITMTWGDWGHPHFWLSAIGLAAAYAIGAWMIQQAYATGPAEIVVGVMTTVDPIVAVLFGFIVLREAVGVTWLITVGMLAAAVASCAGVFLLSKFHPDAERHRQQAPASDAISVTEKG